MEARKEIHTIYHGPHVIDLVNEAISRLAPFSALILTITLVVFFLVRYYLFESYLMQRCYGDKYANLNEVNRRGFVNHHMAGIAKIVMLVVGAYPFVNVTFGKSSVHTLYTRGGVVTYGDVLIVINQIFIAMYVFELLYRAKLSPIACAHHIGAIMIAQSAVAMSLNWEHERDATIEFVLCFVWGAFDLIAEFWPHVAIILYRVYPKDHHFLSRVFLFSFISTLSGTVIETIVVMWLFGSLWHRWTLPFKIVTPLLHVVFSAAQLWGAKNFRSMWLRQKSLLKEVPGNAA
ncbi:hypothetical protein BU24DRAFT_426129 [Aaosphaeria arxii CBS 175.79]|uniref:TLC domain-containing protein n=1 Tax=Aaosphaeria arxii CBS 175.79 TaxID=1450172 RepID=A0A6A5XH54_9PLEO|nr:uncharacterized protein BU24DRAFT_426129 [Aaosphaeria arxii CBS 175.79]KAF2012273.1 hypothetical protein BU24DRAFT_426129 [Aaosphaeria arxii CBS 175.79]